MAGVQGIRPDRNLMKAPCFRMKGEDLRIESSRVKPPVGL